MKNWTAPFKWNRHADGLHERPRIFPCSMSDFFHPGADKWRSEAWEVISECRNLNWLILTKRPELIEDRLPSDWGLGYGNVWLGVAAGGRKSLRRAGILQQIPAAIRFISAEPLLKELDLSPYLNNFHWVITGCERAKKGERRIMSLGWVRDIDRQCRAAGISHFFKQYYANNEGVPREDDRLDNRVVQEWPVSSPTFAD